MSLFDVTTVWLVFSLYLTLLSLLHLAAGHRRALRQRSRCGNLKQPMHCKLSMGDYRQTVIGSKFASNSLVYASRLS